MKKIVLTLAMTSLCWAPLFAQKEKQAQEPDKIEILFKGKTYRLTPINSAPRTKKKSHLVVKKVIEQPALPVDTLPKKRVTHENGSVTAKYANGNVVINGTVTGSVTVNVITYKGDTAPRVTMSVDSGKNQKAISTPENNLPRTLPVIRTRSYMAFLSASKNEKIRVAEYVYKDYEATTNFRRLKKRLKKALYPLEKAVSATEFVLSDAGQTLLKKERGHHNVFNVRNAGIVDICLNKNGDALIADFKKERYSSTDSTGKMRIFYRK
ncbi:MAG: hypothetical protein KBC17_01370 [Candidatus Pacebacteria bacterium]|nr:hypothetical protein [Candidatus Paceibacterota bacterium]